MAPKEKMLLTGALFGMCVLMLVRMSVIVIERLSEPALDQEVSSRVGKLEYDSLTLSRKWSLVKNPTPAQLEEMVKEKEALEQEWEKTQKWLFEEFEKQEKELVRKEGLEEKKTSP